MARATTKEERLKRLAEMTSQSQVPEHIFKNVRSRSEVEALLDHYNQPILKSIAPTPEARKHVMERVRPALKYFCEKFGVEVPDWLEADDHYGHGLDEGPIEPKDWSYLLDEGYPHKEEGGAPSKR